MTESSVDVGTSRSSVLFELLRFVLPVLIGLGAAWAIQHWLVMPKLGYPFPVRRTIAVSESLTEGIFEGDENVAVIISNSAGIEGVDASVVQQSAPEGWRFYNFSINGSKQVEIRLLADALADAGADLVIWLMRPIMLRKPRPVHPDVLHAWGVGELAKDRYWLDSPWVDESSLEMLSSSPWDTSLHFRLRWLNELNYSMRRSMRKGIRSPDHGDWVSPFNLEIVLEDKKLKRHANDISLMLSESMEEFESSEYGSGRAFITEMAEDFADRETTLGIIIASTNPLLAEQYAPIEEDIQRFLEPLAERTGMLVGNAGGLLAADQFADAIHPNAEGREALSTWLGHWLPDPSELKSQDVEE